MVRIVILFFALLQMTIVTLPLTSFHETQPEALVRLQDQHWKPLLEWIYSEYNVYVTAFDSLLGSGHPDETRQRLKDVVFGMNEWEFAGS